MRVLALVLLVACGKSPPPPDKRDEAGRSLVDRVGAIATELCACPDKACRDKVHARYQALTTELDSARMDSALVDKLLADEQQIADCLKKP